MVAFEATSRPPFYYWNGGFYFISFWKLRIAQFWQFSIFQLAYNWIMALRRLDSHYGLSADLLKATEFVSVAFSV